LAAISRVYSIGYVAKILDEDEDWLNEIASELEPEDGRLYIVNGGEDVNVRSWPPAGSAPSVG